MIIVVCGSRGFTNYEQMKRILDRVQPQITMIISGHAEGADKLGEKYAKERNIPLDIMPADWKLHGRSAGIKRNIEMAKKADYVFAFWDGVSRGTKHMLEYCEQHSIPNYVTIYKEELK